jgi:hypothetical protein
MHLQALAAPGVGEHLIKMLLDVNPISVIPKLQSLSTWLQRYRRRWRRQVLAST